MAETLRVKIARALKEDPDLTCVALAKMFKTRTGTVCGTPAWQENMKRKRAAGLVEGPKPGPSKGTSKKSVGASVPKPKVLAMLDKVSKQVAELDKKVSSIL